MEYRDQTTLAKVLCRTPLPSVSFLFATHWREGESILRIPKGLLLHTAERQTSQRLFKVRPLSLLSLSPSFLPVSLSLAEISFCHFYVFRSGTEE